MEKTSPIRLLLVDDHRLTRTGVSRLLRDEADIAVVGEADSGEKALALLEREPFNRPDVVLMDARMPGIGGIEAAHQIRADYPQIKVLGISSIATGVVPSQMLRAGALGFLTKNIGVEELVKAIHMVAAGQHYVSPEVASKLSLDPFNNTRKPLFDKLSRREMQISQMLTDGKRVSQIAEYLKLSPKTVYSYRYRIFEKLGIRSDVELTILAVKHGLTENIRELDNLPAFHTLAG
jgi:two-component system invasion response regulator UvrY